MSSEIASIAFTLPDLMLSALAPIRGERPANVVLRLGEFAALASYVSLVALVRLDQLSWHELMPEEHE